jgi:regulator of replication initiation timing
MAKISSSLDLEPIERLEEKVKLLVAMIGRLRTDQARIADDNARLTRELEEARSRMAEYDNATAEMSSLRQERELIRSRVSEMLEQLEGLNL